MGSSDTLFNVYWIALIASGIIMLAIAGTGFGGLAPGGRAINGVFGLAFLGYGLYLGLFFDGGTYWMFFKAFIVPVLLVVNAIRNAVRRRQPTPPPPPAMQGYPAQPHPSQAYLTPPANTIGGAPAATPQQAAPYQSPIQPG
jgi:hypothetical protein